MRLSRTAAALAACCASANAFSDSSPFILFSTTKLEQPANQAQIQSNGEVSATVQKLLSGCPTERYLIVSQPNLNANDLSARDVVPNLRRSLEKVQSRYTVTEVAGQLNLKEVSDHIQASCEGVVQPFIDELELAPLPSTNAVRTLKDNDGELGMVLEQYEREGSYTIIYAGGPRKETPKTYNAEFPGAVHQELKRNLHLIQQRAKNNSQNLPLFEKYQYFTPGIFTALIAATILISILYVGLLGVASLEVPYGAFDKEMGPAAQKKQQ
ncbi:BIG1-domain-containing protein [Annulohypoxylon maeteangense]|uniref:BIG1-domain-containing protein n=1 Tax=Annulohypoxylon maeteangense TaxID=1927788 RepID=UPI002007EB70|nr:BIG1-domain-containing protein [Annulohypoxylon maeteangense]KAI0885247.1 BIG1-domain-containing protein [Annulohypoxylon maeteangense]